MNLWSGRRGRSLPAPGVPDPGRSHRAEAPPLRHIKYNCINAFVGEQLACSRWRFVGDPPGARKIAPLRKHRHRRINRNAHVQWAATNHAHSSMIVR